MGADQSGGGRKSFTPGDSKDVLAIVNGEKIIREDVEIRMEQADTMNSEMAAKMTEEQRKAALRDMLNQMILETLILQEAAKSGITVSDEEAGWRLKQLRQDFQSDEEMEAYLRKGGTSIAYRKKEDREVALRKKLEATVAAQFKVSDAEIEELWKTAKMSFAYDKIRVRHIMFKTLEDAERISKQIKNRESFEDLAKRFSIEKDSGEHGGDLGWVHKDYFGPLGETVMALPVGKVTDPIKGPEGYHLFRVDGKRPATDQTLDEHREHIRKYVQDRRWLVENGRKDWKKSLMNKAKITNMLDNPQ